MRLIFHIGIHKTGTTAIQRFCAQNGGLLEKRGFLYPSKFTKFEAHHPLPWALGVRHPEHAEDTEPEIIAQEIIQEAEKRKVEAVILSSEEFRNIEAPPVLQKLRDLFPKASAEVVVYLRRQDDFLISEYGQHVRMYSLRFPGSIYDFYLKLNFLNRYNYWGLVNRWENVFGPQAMRVRIYDRKEFPQGNVVADFLQTIGVDVNGLAMSGAKHVNRTLHPMALDILRRLNALPLSQAMHHKVMGVLDKTSFASLEDYDLLSPKNRQDLMANFSRSNALVARKYLGREDGILFEERKADSDHPYRAADPGNTQLIEGLLQCLVEAIQRHKAK